MLESITKRVSKTATSIKTKASDLVDMTVETVQDVTGTGPAVKTVDLDNIGLAMSEGASYWQQLRRGNYSGAVAIISGPKKPEIITETAVAA